MLSKSFGSFGDLENFVNVIGENCDEVRPRVPGHVSAEREFTHILWILHVPDLWHAAARPERGRERRTGLKLVSPDKSPLTVRVNGWFGATVSAWCTKSPPRQRSPP